MISAGRILIKPCGEWKADVTYRMLDLVNYNGYAYLAKKTVIGIEPEGHPDEWHNMLDINKIVEEALVNELADSVSKMLEERFAELLSEARYVTDLFADFDVPTFVRWDTYTANTPYTVGLTTCYEGFALVFGKYATSHTVSAWVKGGIKAECFTHTVSDGKDYGWDRTISASGGTMTGDLILNANPTRDMQAATKQYADGASLESYYAFCANVNSDAIDCAFGKNNEDRIRMLGLQLAMYAWFKGDSKTEYPFTELVKCDSLVDILTNDLAYSELISNHNALNITLLNEYAKNILTNSEELLNCGGYVSNKEYTSKINVTQEMLDGEEPLVISYNVLAETNNVGSGGSARATLKFNNKVIASEEVSGVGRKSETQECLLINFEDFGITAPGEYEFTATTSGATSEANTPRRGKVSLYVLTKKE